MADRQKTLKPEIADIYQRILKSYVEVGRSLNKAEISQYVDNADEAINVLRDNDMVIFDANDEPVGAYPFTMEPRDHKVKVNGHSVYSMCALDALAISPMFNMETRIDSCCYVSGGDISIQQLDMAVLNQVKNRGVHFGISWNAASNNCCATSLCAEMIFLKDRETADTWYSEDADNREIFTINEAIDFASRFFKPLIKLKD